MHTDQQEMAKRFGNFLGVLLFLVIFYVWLFSVQLYPSHSCLHFLTFPKAVPYRGGGHCEAKRATIATPVLHLVPNVGPDVNHRGLPCTAGVRPLPGRWRIMGLESYQAGWTRERSLRANVHPSFFSKLSKNESSKKSFLRAGFVSRFLKKNNNWALTGQIPF